MISNPSSAGNLFILGTTSISEPVFKPVLEPLDKGLIETSDRVFYDLETSGLGMYWVKLPVWCQVKSRSTIKKDKTNLYVIATHDLLLRLVWTDLCFYLFQGTTWLFCSYQQLAAMKCLTVTLSLRPSATFTQMLQLSPTYGLRMVDWLTNINLSRPNQSSLCWRTSLFGWKGLKHQS